MWHGGVVGIVCSRLVERYHRPAILLCPGEGGVLHGSGRSVDGFSLHGALRECRGHLRTFGGHDMAAGLKVAVLANLKLADPEKEDVAVAQENGLDIDLFLDLDQALAWLGN